ncbi:hypothetical protein Tco_1493764 [Tanacetum coccineum]
MRMVGGNGGNQFRQYARQNVGSMNGYNAVQNVENQVGQYAVQNPDGSAEVHHYENCYNNDIFNMFTQEEQYTELLDLIIESHVVQQNKSNVIFVESSVDHSGGTVEQHPTTIEETR